MKFSVLALASVVSTVSAGRPCLNGALAPQMRSVSSAWKAPEILITIGQSCNGYALPGKKLWN